MLSSLTGRITLTLLAILLAAVGLTALLSYNKFERALAEVTEARYRFVLGDVEGTVDASLNLQVGLAELRNLQDLLEREKAADEQIQFIEIFATDGMVLFSTDRSTIGDVLPETWIEAALSAPDRSWGRVEEDGFVLGRTLVSSVGAPLGGVVLSYGRAPSAAKLAHMAWELARITGIAVGLFGVVLMLALIVLLHRPRRRLHQLQALASRLQHDPGGEGALALAAGGSEIRAFRARIEEAHGAVGAAAEEIRRLDEER
jgi:hypothetical protein